MTKMPVALRSVAGTGTAAGWAGNQTVVVDRPVTEAPEKADSGVGVADIIRSATASSTVSASIARGVPVRIAAA